MKTFNESPVTAINIALEPDAAMIQQAGAANARLRSVFPEGFALDASHRPHITLLQRYVRTADLDEVYTAAGKALAGKNVTGLQAIRYYVFAFPDKSGVGAAGIVIEPNDELLRLQRELIDAVAAYAVETGTSAAFFTTPEEPEINQSTIDYVETFVPKASGEHFNPHVTVGLASIDYLNAMLAEPFEAFMFSPVGMGVFQLGNHGTARKQLKALVVKS